MDPLDATEEQDVNSTPISPGERQDTAPVSAPDLSTQGEGEPQAAASVTPIVPTDTSVGPLVDQDVLKEMHTFPSVDKKDMMDNQDNPLYLTKPVQATIYQGNFLSEYTEKLYRDFITDKQSVGNLAQATGDTFLKFADTTDPNSEAHIVGHKMRNLGFHLAHQAHALLEERKKTNPVPEGNDVAGFLAGSTHLILGAVAIMSGVGALATAGGATAAAAATIGGLTYGAITGAQTLGDTYVAGRTDHESYEKSMSYAVVLSALTMGLQAFGLNKVFGITYGKGIGLVRQQLIDSAATMGTVSGSLTMAQLGLGKLAGRYRDLTWSEFTSQTAFASAMGIFCGGTMTAVVVLPMRARTIEVLRAAGMDNETAKAKYKDMSQKAVDSIQNDVSKKFNFTDAQNEVYQKAFNYFRDYAHSRNYPESQFEFHRDAYENADKNWLDPLAAQSEGEVRGEGVPEPNIPGQSATEKTILVMNEAENTPAKSTGEFKVEDPSFSADFDPVKKAIIKGRLKYLNGKLKSLHKEYLKVQKDMDAVEADGKTEENIGKMDRLQKVSEEVYSKLMDAYQEAEAIRSHPEGISIVTGRTPGMDGTELSIDSRDIVRVTAKLAGNVIKTALKNFKAGRATTRAELRFIRQALNRLINVKGLSKDVRNSLKQQYKNLDTAEKLEKNIPLILQAVKEAQADSFMSSIRLGVDKLVDLFSGGNSGRAGLRSVKLDAESQALADIFVKEFNREDTNPVEAGKLLDGTPEATMRFLAAQLKTGKNGNGQDITTSEYADLYQLMANFAKAGRSAKIFESLKLKKIKENMVKKAIEDINGGETKINSPGTASDMIASAIGWGVRTYDTLLSLLARHSGEMMGKSFTELAMSAHNAQRLAETYQMFFVSEHENAILSSFPELNNDRQQIRAMRGRDSQTTGGNSVHFVFTNEAGAQQSVDLSRGAAREKLALSLRPEGNKTMRKAGWNDEAFQTLNDSLRKEDIEYVAKQLEVYAKMYPAFNKVFRSISGYDLPRGMNYNPIFSEGNALDGTSLVSHLFGDSGKRNKSIQSLPYIHEVEGGADLRDVEDFNKLDRYIRDVSHYIGVASTVERMRAVFSDKGVQEAIKAKYGEAPLEEIKRYLEVLTKNSTRNGEEKLFSAVSTFVNNLTQGYINAKPLQAIKHATHMFAGMEVTGVSKYFQFLADIPRAMESGEIRELTDSPYMRRRGTSHMISRDMRLVQEGKDFGVNPSLLDYLPAGSKENLKFVKEILANPTFNDLMFLPTQLGDFGGLVASTWPVYKYFQEAIAKSDPSKPITQVKQEALVEAIKNADASQQSPDFTQSPAWMLSSNPFVKFFSQFKQAPYQYMNKVLTHLQQLGTDRFDPVKFGKAYAVFFLLLPSFFDYVSKGFNDENKVVYTAKRMLLGPFDELVVAGPMLNWTISNILASTMSAITGEKVEGKKFEASDMAGLGASFGESVAQTIAATTKAFKNDFDAADVMHMITKFTEASYPLTGNVGAVARELANAAEGMVLASQSASEGDIVQAWRRAVGGALGYSKSRTNP